MLHFYFKNIECFHSICLLNKEVNMSICMPDVGFIIFFFQRRFLRRCVKILSCFIFNSKIKYFLWIFLFRRVYILYVKELVSQQEWKTNVNRTMCASYDVSHLCLTLGIGGYKWLRATTICNNNVANIMYMLPVWHSNVTADHVTS